MIISADTLLRIVEPFIIWVGNLHFPHVIKLITGTHYFKHADTLNVGDILLTSTNGVGSTYLNFTSIYKHSAMYIGKIDGIPTVIEANGKGVVLTDLVTFFTSKDRLCIVKNKALQMTTEERVQLAALTFVGLPYDYLFDTYNKRFYCHELCARIMLLIYSDLNIEKEIVGFLFWKKEAYTPETFLKDDTNFNLQGDV